MRTFLVGFVLAASFFTGTLAASERLICDQNESRIEVFVKTSLDSFSGQLKKYQADILFNPDATIAGAKVQFRPADLKTGKDKRDRAMCEWLESDKIPNASFVLSSQSAAKEGRLLVTGDFNFHGQTRHLSFPLTVTTEGSTCLLEGEVVIDTRDYDLPVIRMLGVIKVDPIVRVRFHLKGKRLES